MSLQHKLACSLFGAAICSLAVVANAEESVGAIECGEIYDTGYYGPYDYTNYVHYTVNLPEVESHHFNESVESLSGGLSSFKAINDLDYTLRTFPNHHRALAAVSNYAVQVNFSDIEVMESGMPGIECYFKRAVEFKPDDSIVRLIYGSFLHRKGQYELAKLQYNKALEIDPSSAEAHYNLGLYYHDRGNLSMAVQHGRKAYELGYPLQGLKNKLIKKGVWDKIVSQN